MLQPVFPYNGAMKSKRYLPKVTFSNPLGLGRKRRFSQSPAGGSRPKGFVARLRHPNWRKVGKFALIFFGILTIGIVITFAWFAKDLPGPKTIAARSIPESTKIYDRGGELLYEAYGQEKRTVLQPEEMPEIIKQATVAAEDKDFFKHGGISYTGIMRAAIVDITGRGVRQGGSTITQQYVKNAIPEVGKKRTFSRKIKEAILTIEVEQIYSKDQILAQYLNIIPYGNSAAGVESAAKTYFNKSASKDGLSIDEAAFLAAIPQSPTKYNPWGSHTKELIDRRNWVLSRMKTEGYITQTQYDEALKVDTLAKLGKRRQNIQAPHFVFFIKDMLADKYGDEAIESGGLKVTTSLDMNVQRMAEQVFADKFPDAAKKAGASNAAMTVIDPKTGQILAMVGSVDYFDIKNDGNVNVATSPRQPGSSFKPIVYAAGFKEKWNPASTLFDVETNFGGGWTPHNYNGQTNGPVSIRVALGSSLNIPAVKMISLIGVDTAMKQAASMGIKLQKDADFYGPPLVLGSGEVRLVDLVSAYTTFANRGTHMEEQPILKVVDQKGNVLEEARDTKGEDVLDSAIAFEISDILSDKNARAIGFGSAGGILSISGHTVATKTGTTSDYKDAWTIGYTPSVAAGVWVGNNDNSALKNGSSGSMAAAPIWNAFMTRYLAGKPNEEFFRPDNVKRFTIEKYSGKLPADSTPDDQKVTDWLAPWQIPKKPADAVVKLAVCKSNGLLAGDNTPLSEVEERTFANIHSEKPDNPSWENPVRAWAEQHGLGGTAPTGNCDITAAAPSLSLTSPATGANYTSGDIPLKASATSELAVKQVEFQIDGQVVASDTGEPYEATYPVTSLSSGSHSASAVITVSNGQTATSASVTFSVGKGGSSASDTIILSGLAVSPDSTTAQISWQTNIPSTGTVEYGQTSSLGSSASAASGTSHSVTIAGLKPGTPYFYRITAKASSGTTNTSLNSFMTKPSGL